MSTISETALNLWRSSGRTRSSPSGWISGNAVCCQHNGETPDRRGRGGFIVNGNQAISYSCFNCGYKASYQPGRALSFRFRKLLTWMGISENDLRQLVIEAIRVKESMADSLELPIPESEPITYKIRPLPEQALSFMAWGEFYELAKSTEYPKGLIDAVDYVSQRAVDMQKYEFYWTPEVEHKLCYRAIVPFWWQGQIVGYTARTWVDGIKPKYYSEHEPDFVFNLEKQRPESKFVIVCEGVFDAMSVDGVAVLGNECSEQQADLIDDLGKEVIVVPDFDQHTNKHGKRVWPGATLIDRAIEFGWTVSFPVWAERCKDVNSAVVEFGKLFTIKSILDGRQHSRLKIELKKKLVND